MHGAPEEVPAIDTPSTLRLLAVEDDPADSEWLVQLLSQSTICPYHLSFVLTMADAEVSLSFGEVDCVLLDLSLPDSWGLDSIQRILASAPSVPVVVITGANDQEMGLRAIELGAHDYLEKGKVSGDGILRAARWAFARSRALRERSEAASSGPPLGELAAPWVMVDRDLVITSASSGFLGLLGRTEDEVLGSPFSGFVAADETATTLDALEPVRDGGRRTAVVDSVLEPAEGAGVPLVLGVSAAGDRIAVLALQR